MQVLGFVAKTPFWVYSEALSTWYEIGMAAVSKWVACMADARPGPVSIAGQS
jgi:hypothetical protein